MLNDNFFNEPTGQARRMIPSAFFMISMQSFDPYFNLIINLKDCLLGHGHGQAGGRSSEKMWVS